MTTREKDPVLIVLQLTGGNDYMNTVIPYGNPLYYDNRPVLGVSEDDVLKLDDRTGLNPAMRPLQRLYDEGSVAIVHGVGWEGSDRSHFRCMDIWHTAAPDSISNEGWLGQATRQIDPQSENPVTTVNIGRGLPRALVADGVSVASVSNINAYGLLSGMEREAARDEMLGRFLSMYGPAIGRGPVTDYIARTGIDAIKGADMVKAAPERYSSEVEYSASTAGKRLRDVAQIHLAGLGTRILYTEYGGFDTHAAQGNTHPNLLADVSTAIADFWDDLRAHDAADNVIMLVFSEFGRRVRENGNGTDHGAGGAAFVIGPGVRGGMYGEYPSLEPDDLVEGDLAPVQDFRGIYGTILEDWMGLDSMPIINGRFDQPAFIPSMGPEAP